MSANDPDFVRLQQLQSREWSYLKAQERQAGRLAKTVTNCPCRAQHERAACERCNAQQGYKAEPQHLTNSTAYKAAAQAQQQEQALSHRLAGDNRQALITSLEQRLQHADTSLRTCEQELRMARQNVESLALQKGQIDQERHFEGQAVEALTTSLLAARAAPVSTHLLPKEQIADMVQHVQAAREHMDRCDVHVKTALHAQLAHLQALQQSIPSSAPAFTKVLATLENMVGGLESSSRQHQQSVQSTQAALDEISGNVSTEAASLADHAAKPARRVPPGRKCKIGQTPGAIAVCKSQSGKAGLPATTGKHRSACAPDSAGLQEGCCVNKRPRQH